MQKYYCKKIQIIDALGIKSGIRIDNVTAEYDENKESMRIFGKLYKMDNYSHFDHKPTVLCELYDEKKGILNCQKGKIYGDITILDNVTFSCIIKEYSLIDWNETSQILLYVI